MARADARVDDPLAAARVQLRRHPDDLERVPELGRGRPGPTAAGSATASGCSTWARAGRLDLRRRRPGRDRADAALRRRGRCCRALPVRRFLACSWSRSSASPRLRRAPRLTSSAGTATGAAGEHERRRTPTPARRAPSRAAAGWWGMAIFVASEATLFALLIGTYFYLRFKNVHWPPAGIPEPKLVVPLVLLGVLVATSIPVQLAARAGRAGRLGAARLCCSRRARRAGRLLRDAGARVLGDDLGASRPQRHAYGSIYYMLLGADHAHVALGLLLNVWLLGKLARGLTPYRLNALQAIALYWHAVNVITIAVPYDPLAGAMSLRRLASCSGSGSSRGGTRLVRVVPRRHRGLDGGLQSGERPLGDSARHGRSRSRSSRRARRSRRGRVDRRLPRDPGRRRAGPAAAGPAALLRHRRRCSANARLLHGHPALRHRDDRRPACHQA